MSKRYGKLIQSPTTGLSEMLLHHKQDVFDWIAERADVEASESENQEKKIPSPVRDTKLVDEQA